MYVLFALVSENRTVLGVETLRRNLFGVQGIHTMDIEEMKSHNVYPVVKTVEDFNRETHEESVIYGFDTEQDLVIGHVTLTPKPIFYTKYEFRQLFTQSEKVGIYTAAETDIVLRVALDDLASAEVIELYREETRNYLQYLVSQGLLSQERFNEILQEG